MQRLLLGLIGIVGTLFTVSLLALVTGSLSEEAIIKRLAPYGQVYTEQTSVGTGGAAPGSATQPTENIAQKIYSKFCIACHSSGVAGAPKYGDKTAWKARLADNGGTMYGIVAGLSDQDIKELAVYYSAQKMSVGMAKPDLVSLGERIYRAGNPATGVAACMSCHGPDGTGNGLAKFPRLSGQHSDYTLSQLQQYKSGQRSSDPSETMRTIAGRMTDLEMKAVSSYVEGLRSADNNS